MKKSILLFSLFFFLSQINAVSAFPARETLIADFKSYTLDYTVIGYTVQNNPIYAFSLGEGKTFVIVDAAIHGNEHANALLLRNFVHWLKHNQSAYAQNILKRLKIVFIPIVNYDRYNISRKNYNGVDLNRNFLYRWGLAGSNDSAAYDYRGANALSEPESTALHNYFKNQKPKVYINLHHHFEGWKGVAHLAYVDKTPYYRLYDNYKTVCATFGVTPWNNVTVSGGGYAVDDAYYYGGAYAFLIETKENPPTVEEVSEGGEVFNQFLCFIVAVSNVWGQEAKQILPNRELTIALVSFILAVFCLSLLRD